MKYYWRHTQDSPVVGPLSVHELLAGMKAGSIPRDSYASSCIGDGKADVERWRDCDWFGITQIPEIAAHYPSAAEPAKPEPLQPWIYLS